ncbi:MAG: DUF397 domain-containing protein [Micromonosporaceae bacterium]|nr:DUF397 domain-containing protein [Micromonosporaceae bacterium]
MTTSDPRPPIISFINWRKDNSSHDTGCVEIADGPEGWVAVRDSKDAGTGPVLRFNATEWAAFIRGIRDRTLVA